MPYIELENISFEYPNQTLALNEVSLSIEKGQKLAVVGENGSGKSTFLEALARRCGIHIWRSEHGARYQANQHEKTLHKYMRVDWIDGKVPGSFFGADHTSYQRLNYYPPCSLPAPADAPHVPVTGHLGISHHTDSGAITVLLQDAQPGLQMWQGDRWHLIAPHADALVINIGDVVQVWSNDRYRAPLHRVLAHASTPRYSAPYFYNPDYAAVYEPLLGACDSAHPPRYQPISWGEFRAARAVGDYADQGEEVQISDYRINTT